MSSVFSNRLFKPSIRPIALIGSLGLVLLSALITLFLSYGVNKQVVDISRNFELREQVNRVARIAYNIEVSRRGYLLTLDKDYLERYTASISNMDRTLSDLADMTKDDPQQHVRVIELKAMVERGQHDVRQTIELARQGKVTEAIEQIQSDEGRKLRDEITGAVSQFVATEGQELEQRNAYIDRMRFWLTVTSIVALGSAVMLVFLLMSRVQRATRVLFEGQSLLMSEKELLEARVLERTSELEQERAIAERERKRVEVLLQDSNHRIGNSLATVSSLLGLQWRQTRSEEARAALSAARDRVQTVSIAHRRLRLGDDLETTRIDEFLETVIEDIRNAIGEDSKIAFATDFEKLDLKSRDATTIGIILGELITNAVKHAFKGLPVGKISVSFRCEAGVPELCVEDNGIGWSGQDRENNKDHSGLGTLVVEQLCMQFGGKPVYSLAENGQGTRVIVRFSSLNNSEGENNAAQDKE